MHGKCLMITNTKTEVIQRNKTILQSAYVILYYNEAFSSPASTTLTTLTHSWTQVVLTVEIVWEGMIAVIEAEKSKIQRGEIAPPGRSNPKMGCGFSDSLYNPVNFFVYPYLNLFFQLKFWKDRWNKKEKINQNMTILSHVFCQDCTPRFPLPLACRAVPCF